MKIKIFLRTFYSPCIYHLFFKLVALIDNNFIEFLQGNEDGSGHVHIVKVSLRYIFRKILSCFQ